MATSFMMTISSKPQLLIVLYIHVYTFSSPHHEKPPYVTFTANLQAAAPSFATYDKKHICTTIRHFGRRHDVFLKERFGSETHLTTLT